MWTGSSGPYRPQQPGQTASSHPHWAAGGEGNRPSPSPSGMPSNHRGNGTGSASGSRSVPLLGATQNGVDEDGIPEPPKSFPELESMSLRDLRNLNDENAIFEDFISKHKYQCELEEVVARVQADADAFEREHIQIAAMTDNVGDEEELGRMREKLRELEEEVTRLQRVKGKWSEQNSPEKLMERLQIAMRESETVSAGLEKDMLSSSMNFDTFLTQYIASRKKYHERSLKLEQLKLEAKKKSFGR